MAKVKVLIDVIYAKHIEIEVPDDGANKEELIEEAMQFEIEKLPESVCGFHYAWETYEEV